MTLSSTESCGNTRMFWKVRARPWAATRSELWPVMSLPRYSTVPLSGL